MSQAFLWELDKTRNKAAKIFFSIEHDMSVWKNN